MFAQTRKSGSHIYSASKNCCWIKKGAIHMRYQVNDCQVCCCCCCYLLFIPLVSRWCCGGGSSFCCDLTWDGDGNISFEFGIVRGVVVVASRVSYKFRCTAVWTSVSLISGSSINSSIIIWHSCAGKSLLSTDCMIESNAWSFQ